MLNFEEKGPYIHIYTKANTVTHIHTPIYTYACTHTRANIHIHRLIYTYIETDACICNNKLVVCCCDLYCFMVTFVFYIKFIQYKIVFALYIFIF